MPVNTADLGPGGTANNPNGLQGTTEFGRVSSATLGTALQPALSFSDNSLGFYQSANSTIAQSYGSFNLFTNTVAMSMRTYGDAPADQVIGQWGIIQNASGMSIFYSSGASIYYFGGSTLSAVQP